MTSGDTITALSTAPGPAARAIVRLSGPDSWSLAQSLCPAAKLIPSHATSTRAIFQNLSIPTTLYPFRAPRSYTGEDLIEFHLPGNSLLVRYLVDHLVARGARPADAGEFTARAYFNGRLDLSEAEGVAAAISAQNDAELKAARQLLAGELARRLKPAMELIAQTLALVEVGIDFVEEDVTFLSPAEIARRLTDVRALLDDLVANSARFQTLTHEPRVVLLGRPNAGKSTLLNALAGRQRAVVSSVAGTTRDALSADVPLARGIIRLIDVAGLDAADAAGGAREIVGVSSQQDIEGQMRDRALRELEAADFVLLIHDASTSAPPLVPPRNPDLLVLTKSDLATSSIPGAISVSAHTGHHLGLLRDHLDRLAFGTSPAGASLTLNDRHLQAIQESLDALARAAATDRPELLALDLRDALDALGRVLGSVSPDELLGRIFAAFCIGK